MQIFEVNDLCMYPILLSSIISTLIYLLGWSYPTWFLVFPCLLYLLQHLLSIWTCYSLDILVDCLSDKSSLEFFNKIFLVLCVEIFTGQGRRRFKWKWSDDFGMKNSFLNPKVHPDIRIKWPRCSGNEDWSLKSKNSLPLRAKKIASNRMDYLNTVWKLKNFSAARILYESELWKLYFLKNCQKTSKIESFWGFSPLPNMISRKIWVTAFTQCGNFRIYLPLNFTWNHF